MTEHKFNIKDRVHVERCASWMDDSFDGVVDGYADDLVHVRKPNVTAGHVGGFYHEMQITPIESSQPVQLRLF